MDRAGTTDDRASARTGERRRLGIAALVAVLAVLAGLVFVAFIGARSDQPTIDQARAEAIARDFFDQAHGAGVSIANVKVMDIHLDSDASGQVVWKVNISGDVIDTTRPASSSYTSYMWLSVGAESGAVTVFSQG